MIYNAVSVKEVIGKIIRRTRLTDTTYHDDFLTWIPEAMGMMQTKYELHLVPATLDIKDHCAKLPCGLKALEVVTHNDCVMMEGSAKVAPRANPVIYPNGKSATGDKDNLFRTDVTSTVWINQADHAVIRGQDILPDKGAVSDEWFKLQMGWIQTSFKEGQIVIHYRKMPTDKDGYPLIPDNENYKEALYYFCRRNMSEVGWVDPIFKWADLELKWEQSAGRAIAEITYPPVFRMERYRRSLNYIIPPDNYYDNAFINAEERNWIE